MMLREFFEHTGEGIVNDLKTKLRERKVNATGNLSRSIRFDATEKRLVVSAAGYVFSVEDGTGPGSAVTASAIEKWLDAKAIPVWQGSTRKSQSYVIARAINRRGTRLFQKGGNSGVISDVINNKLLERLAEQVAEEFEGTFLRGIAQATIDGVQNI